MLTPLSKLPLNSRVGVVGAGVSGLTFSYFLSKLRPDIQITLIEGQKRTGGWIWSWNSPEGKSESFMLEKGPRTLRGVSEGTVLMIDILRDLHAQDLLQCIPKNSVANRKFILGPRNELVQVPSSLSSAVKFFTNPVSRGLISGLVSEGFRKNQGSIKQDESVSDFLSRRFGNHDVGKNIVSAVIRGIYADSIDTISVRRALRKLYEMEKNEGSIIKALLSSLFKKAPDTQILPQRLTQYQEAFHKDPQNLINLSKTLKQYPMLGFQGGLEVFPKLLRKELESLDNVKVIENSTVDSVEHEGNKISLTTTNSSEEKTMKFDHLRLTTIPSIASKILESSNSTLSSILREIPNNTIALINFYHPTKDLIDAKYRAFGYLVPQANTNPEKLLGVIFDSVIEKNFQPVFADHVMNKRQNYTKITAMLGGYMFNNQDTTVIPSHSEMKQSVYKILQNHLGFEMSDISEGHLEITVAKNALPQYKVGYDNWQQKVEEAFISDYKGKISLGGMGFASGPGVPDVIIDSMKDAVSMSK